MKKLLLLTSVAALTVLAVGCKKSSTDDSSGGSTGMTVEQKATPILFKITGETCYYCGDWGWQAWIDLSNNFKGNSFCWANYGDGFSNKYFRNQELNATMDPMEVNFEEGGGKPNFATNGVDYSTSTANAKNAATAFLATKPPVGVALEANLEGDKLTVKAAAKFFEAVSGDYYMGAYVVENNVMGPQSGPIGASGNVAHHYVMRGSMTNNAFGESIINGDAAVGKQIEKTFTVDIPATYNKANLSYGVIVWTKTGTKYAFVNSATTQK
jgi:hypothetical protein